MTRRLLILRPEPGAAATAARATARGFEVAVAPLFDIVAVAWTPPEASAFDAVMLTSANAVRHAGPALTAYSRLPLYAVGAATAVAARAAGFADVAAGDRDASALLARIAADGAGRLLHLAGREHLATDHPDLTIVRRVVYAAEAVRSLPALAGTALSEGAIALLHSPRAAAMFRRLVDQAGYDPAAIRIAAISDTTGEVAGTGWASVVTAEMPNDDALLAAAARLCD